MLPHEKHAASIFKGYLAKAADLSWNICLYFKSYFFDSTFT